MTRVQLHPAMDRWMMGDRYGVIVAVLWKKIKGVRTEIARVKLDKSGKTITCRLADLTEV